MAQAVFGLAARDRAHQNGGSGMTRETPARRPRKAPATKSPELIEGILNAVEGGETLTAACRAAGCSVRAFYNWAEQDPRIDARLARAREIGFDTIADRVRQTARGETGWSTGDVKRDRLIADVDLKLLACWDRRYSERRVIAGDPEAPLGPPPPEGTAAEILVSLLGVLEARQRTAEALGWQDNLTAEQAAFLAHDHPPLPQIAHVKTRPNFRQLPSTPRKD